MWFRVAHYKPQSPQQRSLDLPHRRMLSGEASVFVVAFKQNFSRFSEYAYSVLFHVQSFSMNSVRPYLSQLHCISYSMQIAVRFFIGAVLDMHSSQNVEFSTIAV